MRYLIAEILIFFDSVDRGINTEKRRVEKKNIYYLQQGEKYTKNECVRHFLTKYPNILWCVNQIQAENVSNE